MSNKEKEMAISLAVLGISKDELLEKLLVRLQHDAIDEMDELLNTRFNRALQEMIGRAVEAYAKKHLEERVKDAVEGMTFQETNCYGEAKRSPKTLREFAAEKLESFLTDEVDRNGRTAHECRQRSDSFYKVGTRVVVMVDGLLMRTIEAEMKKALTGANAQIVGGIETAVKSKLSEIAAKLNVKAELKR